MPDAPLTPAPKLRNLAVAALAILGAAAGAAQARIPPNFGPKVPPEPPPADSLLSGVTVSVPRIVQRTGYGVVGIETSLSVRVPYGDLDMSTPAGIETLRTRVGEAATYVCDQLDRMFPEGMPDERSCSRLAVAKAGPQMRQARLTD